MIQDDILEVGSRFAVTWNELSKGLPRYRLDLSWPSVGTLDLLLFPLRSKRRLTPVEESILDATAAYLAGLTHDCWSRFPEKPEILVSRLKDQKDITIFARGGSFLGEGEGFVVNVTHALRELLKKPSGAHSFYASETRTLLPNENLLSSFASGLLSGLCPLGEGAWKSISPDAFSECLVAANQFMSRSAADYYIGSNPSEPLGGMAALYERGLVLPPLGSDEQVFASRGCDGLISYLKSNVSDSKTRSELCRNLSKSTDEQIAFSGFIVATALDDQLVDPSLLALSQRFRLSLPTLRKALLVSRRLLERSPSWVEDLLEDDKDRAVVAMQRERSLGFLPLLFIDELGLFYEPTMSPIFDLVANARPQEALEMLRTLLLAKGRHPDLLQQFAYLLLILGEYESVAEELSYLQGLYAPGNSLFQNKYHELAALYYDATAQKGDALIHFEKLCFSGVTPSSGVHLYNRLFDYYLVKGDLTKAAQLISKFPGTAAFSFLRTKLSLLLADIQNSFDENSHKQLTQLLQLAPSDVELFTLYRKHLFAATP